MESFIDKNGFQKCIVCEKKFHISDPSTAEFQNKKIICKKCWMFIYDSMSWGSKREVRIIIDYKKVTIPHSVKWAVWKRDEFKCKHCGTSDNLSVDHILPESLGGTLKMDNLQTLCRRCNSVKNNKV